MHDLRQWTHDRHRTVDDTPYGGGAGMVMKPEPWGEALDEVAHRRAPPSIVTTPSRRAVHPGARPRAGGTQDHLVFACGRYEGIDQRVIDHAATLGTVREISLGDYVLNGGEVAALAITEAVVRLLPGFMGNAESLAEESHEDGLLEYPVYTKPASWRGHEVPEVLLSGDHAADRRVAARAGASDARRSAGPTCCRPSSPCSTASMCDPRSPADAGELFTLQRACWVQETHANPGVRIPALHESLDDVRAWIGRGRGARRARRPAGSSARSAAALDGDDLGHRPADGRARPAGPGPRPGCSRRSRRRRRPRSTSYALFTGAGSVRNQRMYKKAGYRLRRRAVDARCASRMTSRRGR